MNLLTRIIASLRYPETAWGKTLHRLIPIGLLVALLILGLGGFATYRIVAPSRLEESIDPSSFLLRNFQSIPFSGVDQTPLEGWFIPSVRGAPVVFLCHGYRSNRAELLTLASTFQENGYNLFLFDFRGHGVSGPRTCTLGVKEAGDLLSAIDLVLARDDVDHDRAGIWGVTLGAYAALSASVESDKIKTLVVDSPFESPARFVEMQSALVLGVDNLVLNKLALFGFNLINLFAARSGEAFLNSLDALQQRTKLFITNEQDHVLEMQTLNIFNHAPQPKELIRLRHSKTSILYDIERKNYENIVVEFFKKNLPLRLEPRTH
ncbi:MAG: alpha/beta fold hydrolase [Acidobacteriota bacterium]